MREVTEMLDATEPAVNSLLRRARAAFESRLPAAGSSDEFRATRWSYGHA